MDQLHTGARRLRRLWRHQGGSATLETAAMAMIVFALLTAVIVGLNSRGTQIGNSIGSVLIHYINGGQGAQPGAVNVGTVNVGAVNVGAANVGATTLGVPALLQVPATVPAQAPAAQTSGIRIDLTVLAGVIGAIAGVIGALVVIGVAVFLGATVGTVALVVAVVVAAVVGAVIGIIYYFKSGKFNPLMIFALGFLGGVAVGLIVVAWPAILAGARALGSRIAALWTGRVVPFLRSAGSWLAGRWQALRDGIASAWRGLVNGITSRWQAARTWVQNNLLSRLGRAKLWKAIEEWEKGLIKGAYRWMLRNPILSKLPRWLLKMELKSLPGIFLYVIGRVLHGAITGQWPRPIDVVVELVLVTVLAGIPAPFIFKILMGIIGGLIKAWIAPPPTQQQPTPQPTPTPTPTPSPVTPSPTPSPTLPPTSTPTPSPTPTVTPSPTPPPPTSTPSPQPTP